jgi:hypothetical protein
MCITAVVVSKLLLSPFNTIAFILITSVTIGWATIAWIRHIVVCRVRSLQLSFGLEDFYLRKHWTSSTRQLIGSERHSKALLISSTISLAHNIRRQTTGAGLS